MRRNQRMRAVAAIPIIAIVTLARVGDAQQPQALVDAEQVLSAISRGVDYLKREQTPRGRWSEMPGYDGGVTALCTLALLNSGVERTDPVITRALEYLRSIEPQKTYTVALQTMAFCAANPKRDLLLIQRNVQWLEGNQITQGDRSGSWSYPGAAGDNSNSQFALLALYDAQSIGAKVSRQTWERSIEYWERSQNGDGSWGYTPGDAGYGSMTCAGIAAYAICSAALKEGDASVDGGRVDCCRSHEDDDVLERGIDWLARNFSVRHNPQPVQGGQPALYYYLYGLERAGRLTARRFIGKHDWYREGSEVLVHEQDPLSHFWQGTWHAERMPHIGTSFALLFLSKGRRPVILGKVKYGDDDEWNRHRNDAAHLAAYTERAWDMGLTWQVMDPAQSTVDDLLQAPVLYISGSTMPALEGQAEKLRQYIDRGGFIFAEACCSNSEAFDKGFRKLMREVFPEEEYQLRLVEPNHPIWRMEEIIRPDSPYVGKLWAVEYGCRSCVVFSTEDLSCYWELAHPARRTTYPPPVAQHVSDALAIGVNVLTYATNREPKGKEQSFISPLASLEGESLGKRGTIEIAKLSHGGGCNDAPGAIMNLLRAAVQGDVRLQAGLEVPLIDVSDEELFRYHVVFMHGRYNFEFSPAEREQLKKYLERGGTLFADSICASKEFTAAFRREMGKVFPNATLETIPASDPIWTDTFGGFDVRRVTLRDPQQTGANETVSARHREIAPQLEGIKLDGRWIVVFSPYDLSCALEQHEALTCRGYSREDAARIGLNVLLYTINQ